MKIKYIIIIVIALSIGFLVYCWYAESLFLLEGRGFCERMGYDSVSILGTYSEKFGKVNCVSCYNEECIYEEFNVKKRFGIIMEDKTEE